MPVYVYRAITKSGQEVKNRVEDTNRFNLIKKLKRNNLIPISVTQVNINKMRNQKANKKKLMSNSDIIKRASINSAAVKNRKTQITLKERLSLIVSTGEKITTRDVMVFTQNFYLLKKANFNNIHALSTIIESTENLSFREILEDILAGVESRREHVYYYGILYRNFPLHICEYDKSRRAFWFAYQCT